MMSPFGSLYSDRSSVLAPVELLPAQRNALDNLERHVGAHHVTSLMSRPGAGKTTILRALHERMGEAYLTMRKLIRPSMLDAFSMLAGMEASDEGVSFTALPGIVIGSGGAPFGSGSPSGD